MTPAELEAHPDRALWQSRYFSYKIGRAKGEELLETDPEFIRRVKKRAKKIERAEKAAESDSGFSRTPEELKAMRAKRGKTENKIESL